MVDDVLLHYGWRELQHGKLWQLTLYALFFIFYCFDCLHISCWFLSFLAQPNFIVSVQCVFVGTFYMNRSPPNEDVIMTVTFSPLHHHFIPWNTEDEFRKKIFSKYNESEWGLVLLKHHVSIINVVDMTCLLNPYDNFSIINRLKVIIQNIFIAIA